MGIIQWARDGGVGDITIGDANTSQQTDPSDAQRQQAPALLMSGQQSAPSIDFADPQYAGDNVDPKMQFTDLERRYLADNASPARPRFASNVSPQSVSNYSLAALNKVAADAGIDVGALTVTSSIRTPADQARIMYGQLEADNISSYLNPGQQVIAVYHAGKDRGDNAADIQSAMVAKIQQLQDKNEVVSNHLGDPSKLNVFDIAPSSIPAGKTQAFQNALTDAVASNGISKFFSPYTSVHDPAFHLEINQPISTNSAGEIDQRRVLRLMEILRQNENSE